MSNIVSVQFTRFQDLDSDGNLDGEPTLGYRIYDDYGADYNNCYDQSPIRRLPFFVFK